MTQAERRWEGGQARENSKKNSFLKSFYTDFHLRGSCEAQILVELPNVEDHAAPEQRFVHKLAALGFCRRRL